MSSQHLKALHEAGVSIWLDDLSRGRIESGQLAGLIAGSYVTGVTTNPTIFAGAFKDMSLYGQQLATLGGRPTAEIIQQLMVADVKDACQLFDGVYHDTGGYDGRVSIEVEPGLARDTAATIAQAAQLFDLVGQPNVLIKIPATAEGLPAIRASIAAGISVNVTLIFSLARYRQVIDAYFGGLEDALECGRDISGIHSVASFFVSRVDTEVDHRLAQIGTAPATQLLGQAAVANARLAFAEYQKAIASPRFLALQEEGANLQRPLWASTGTKNPAYPDTLYVADLIARPCINTMPQATMDAFDDHGVVNGDTITGFIDDATTTLTQLAAVGVDYDEVTALLEREGVDKFVASWRDLTEAVAAATTGGHP